jgi:hypothetical protein
MSNSKKKFLEWAGEMRLIAATDADPVNTKINLGLRDDEVGEIHKIVITSMLGLAAATTAAKLDFVLSMDPDVKDDPGEETTYEDLEVFYSEHRMRSPMQLVADIDEVIDDGQNRNLDFSPPLLLGTNIGISSQATWLTADSTASLRVKVYYTRRKANIVELNQILLKRR